VGVIKDHPDARSRSSGEYLLGRGMGSILSRNEPSDKAGAIHFKLLAMAQERWRKVNGSELLPLVRAGVRFVDGVQETPKTSKGEMQENAA
jgi:hypothetical protein